MSKIITADDIVQAIDVGYKKKKIEKAREYIGASGVGTPCDAALAFSLRGFPEPQIAPRTQRIFALGHLLEDIVVKDLKENADVRVWEVDGLTGRQHSYSMYGGHVSCHTDGLIETDDEMVRILEIKSMNHASHQKFIKHGVQKAHPKYFAQLQMMMGMSGIHSSVFIAISKNTSEYHCEIVDYDDIEYNYLQSKVERVMSGEAEKISDNPDTFSCRFCFKKAACWEGLEVPVRCSTCQFAYPREDGGWQCDKHDREAIHACDDYKLYKPKDKT